MKKSPIPENTIVAAIRSMGYTDEQMTAHGFRTTASTNLNEQGWNSDLIELSLAHVDGYSVRAAYNRAERLAERREMMQAWADWVDGLREKYNDSPLLQRTESSVQNQQTDSAVIAACQQRV
jgi:integrase